MALVRAAGTVPWRDGPGGIEVLLVHRPRYDDWSFPKGKLDPGEGFAEAAVRETEEETGLAVQLGLALPSRQYALPARGDTKLVRYWAGRVTGSGAPEHEVDEARWATPERARGLLTSPDDAKVLDALVTAEEDERLRTWPLLVVRHAVALSRSRYQGEDDTKRPLTPPGERRAQDLVDVLAAYVPARIVTSPSLRCRATVRPAAKALGLRLQRRAALSEEGFAQSSAKAARVLRDLLRDAEPAVICTHRPVLPALLDQLAVLAVAHPEAEAVLSAASEDGLRKGEVLVCHLTGGGADATVVAAEVLES